MYLVKYNSLMIDLNQKELTIIVNVLKQVQFVYKDSLLVNPLIKKLDSHIEKPKPEDIPIVPQDHKEAK